MRWPTETACEVQAKEYFAPKWPKDRRKHKFTASVGWKNFSC